ncbi:MAG: hypothetical protein MI866_00135 [Bacteroidales bacterium]|nr:hypothetical protein [Bacteroidales bacterium]
MKQITYILSTLLISLAFSSCQLEPDFPVPGFDNTDLEWEIRRDTVPTIFEMGIFMTVPNGIETIEVKDAITNDHIDYITGYEGKQEVKMIYPLDLTPISTDVDTVLNFTFRAVDKRGAGFNRSVRLHVYKTSRPELVDLEGGKQVNINVPVYAPRGRVTCGAVPIKSIEYRFNDEQRFYFEPPADTLIYDYDLATDVGLKNMENGGDTGLFEIIITDDRDWVYTEQINLTFVDYVIVPSKVSFTSKEWIIETDEFNRIIKMQTTASTGDTDQLDISYHDNGYVEHINSSYTTPSVIYMHSSTYVFDELNRYKEIRKTTYRIDTADDSKYNESEVIVANEFVYDANGFLKSYVAVDRSLRMERDDFYKDHFGTGQPLFTVYLNGRSAREAKQIALLTFKPVRNPIHINFYMPITDAVSGFGTILSYCLSEYIIDRYHPSPEYFASGGVREDSGYGYRWLSIRTNEETGLVENFTKHQIRYESESLDPYDLHYD